MNEIAEPTSITESAAQLLCPSDGAHYNIPFEQYFRWDAINWHSLEPARRSLLHARNSTLFPRRSTKGMVFGGAFHAAVLEPEKFESTYSVLPKFDAHPNSNAYKAMKAAWENAHMKHVPLTTDEASSLMAMQRAAYAHPTASAILKAKGANEVSIVWRDRETGDRCKSRIDKLCKLPAKLIRPGAAGDLICNVDVKTTSKIEMFDNEVAKYGYHCQLAMQQEGLRTLEPGSFTSIIIAIESEAPDFDVVVYTCADAVESGRLMYRRLLNEVSKAKRTNYWPGICPVGSMPVVLPRWAREDDESGL